MKKKIILTLCILILLVSAVSATNTILCYQETTNDSFVTAINPTVADGDCGIYNGSYSWKGNWLTTDVRKIQKAFDGNWTLQSVAEINTSNGAAYFFMNYTIPSGANDRSLLRFSGHDITATGQNISLLGVDFSTGKLQFRISAILRDEGGGAVNDDRINVTIWNESSSKWEILFASGSLGSAIVREEAMWWNVTDITNLSLTFIDETTNTQITGETFSIFLEKSDFSNTFSTTTNPFVIPNLDVDLFTKLKVSSTNYPERQYLNIDLRGGTRSSPVNFTVYLINNTIGSEVLFNIVSTDGLAPLENVRTVFTKIINGTSTVVAEEISDFAGQVVLTLDQDTQYTINFSKTGFEDRTILLEPKNADYLIQMVSTVGAYNQSVHEGIRYRFEPVNTVLNNNTKYNFTFTLNSTVWEVTNCTLKLFNGTILLSQSSSFTSTSCFIRIELNTSIMTDIIAEGIYELDSQFEFTATQNYKVIFNYIGEFSLKSFLDDLSDFGMAGFDDFGRMILALIVIFIITVIAAREVSFANQEVLILLVIAQVWLFSSVNWLFLNFTPIPTIAGFDLKKYIIAILVTMAGGAFLIEKFTKT